MHATNKIIIRLLFNSSVIIIVVVSNFISVNPVLIVRVSSVFVVVVQLVVAIRVGPSSLESALIVKPRQGGTRDGNVIQGTRIPCDRGDAGNV